MKRDPATRATSMQEVAHDSTMPETSGPIAAAQRRGKP